MEFDYIDTTLFKQILKLAQPNTFIPDMHAFFQAFEKHAQYKYPLQDGSYRVTLDVKYDFKFIKEDIVAKMQFEEVDDGDIYSQIKQNKLSLDAKALGIKMERDRVSLIASKFFKSTFMVVNADRRATLEVVEIGICLLKDYPGAFHMAKIIRSLAKGNK